MSNRRLPFLSPGQTVLLSLCLVICVGTGLLALPVARVTSLSYTDLFFTATSATCVTGLFTIPLSNFTTFGHVVILALIQIGGLGLITLSFMFMALFVELGLSTQLMAGGILELESWKNMQHLLTFIMLVTFGSEIIGALCIFSILKTDLPFSAALFNSFFHAISAFCSAGITLPEPYLGVSSNTFTIQLTTTVLMLIGGLGFITWYEIVEYAKSRYAKRRFRFSLHSKIVLLGSISLLICSSIIIWLLEHDNILVGLSFPRICLSSLLQAVSYRSTGFLITQPQDLTLATLFFILFISFIGSSPASTGSGIKITTFAVFAATIKAALSGTLHVDMKGRRIAKDQVFKVIAIVSLSLCWIFFLTFLLLISENSRSFFEIFFEAWASFTTLGITLGVTPTLSFLGKYMIMMSMILGRIGTFTLILALKMVRKRESIEFSYPEERIMIG